jgi:hypothetical protein
VTRPPGAQECPGEPGGPEGSREQRGEKAFAALALIAVAAAVLGLCANLAAWSAADRIDFALNAERVPATVVGVHDGSPEVRFTTGAGTPAVATAEGTYQHGSSRDITVHRHRNDPERVSTAHPLASSVWIPLGAGLLTALLGAVLGSRRDFGGGLGAWYVRISHERSYRFSCGSTETRSRFAS